MSSSEEQITVNDVSASETGSPNSDENIAVRFDHVTKTYRLYKNDRARFASLIKGVEAASCGAVNANNDLSFTIHRGEAVAFLGHNGAGKSTALKLITGVLYPTSGTVEVNGRVSALLELTAGFDRQLTGRENIALRSQILGLSQEDARDLEPHIIEFADLDQYIDQPMRMYSSGMKARLGFAFAVAVDPEILVVDEALSVGDQAFRKKCNRRIHEIMSNENVTVLFVTHTSSAAKELCRRGIVLEKGTLLFDGDIAEAISFYDSRC